MGIEVPAEKDKMDFFKAIAAKVKQLKPQMTEDDINL